jgi:hypothetical protein
MTQPTPETIAKTNGNGLIDGASSSAAAFQELTRAYQELAAKNARNVTAAIQSLSAVKSPTEFVALQQTLIKECVQAAVSDSQNIAHLTAAVFTAAFEPMKKQMEAARQTRSR